MLILIQVMEPSGVEAGGTTNDTVHLVSLFQQELSPTIPKIVRYPGGAMFALAFRLTDKIHPGQ